MLIDSGASHNFAPSKLVQALHLPVVTIQTSEITLPNGSKMSSEIACKIHVELHPGVVRKITFVVADVSKPFVLTHKMQNCNIGIAAAISILQLQYQYCSFSEWNCDIPIHPQLLHKMGDCDIGMAAAISVLQLQYPHPSPTTPMLRCHC